MKVFSELAADALKRDDVPQFLLWCLARELDQEGRGWVEYRDLVAAAEGIFSRGYVSRLIRNQKAMRFYFHWQGIGHYGKGWVNGEDDATKRTLGLHSYSRRWRCYFCKGTRHNCYCEEGITRIEEWKDEGLHTYSRELCLKSAARVSGAAGLGMAIDVDLAYFAQNRKAVLLAVYLAGKPETPLSREWIKQRTGIPERTQRDYGKAGVFKAVAQYAYIPLPAEQVNPVIRQHPGAFIRDGKVWIQRPNSYQTDFRFWARRPNRHARRRAALKRSVARTYQGCGPAGLLLHNRSTRRLSPNVFGSATGLKPEGRMYYGSSKKLARAKAKNMRTDAAGNYTSKGQPPSAVHLVRERDGTWRVESAYILDTYDEFTKGLINIGGYPGGMAAV